MITADQARIMTKSATLKNIELKIKEAAQCGDRSVNVFVNSDDSERDEIIKYLQESGYVVKGLPEAPPAMYTLYVPSGFIATDVMTIEWC